MNLNKYIAELYANRAISGLELNIQQSLLDLNTSFGSIFKELDISLGNNLDLGALEGKFK